MADKLSSRQRLEQILAQRSASQPTGVPSCGSVFRNPSHELQAGQLIESCGLKGYRLGQAMVSAKHANFIINLGQARPRDLKALVTYIAAIVQDKCGINLQQEVKIVGTA